MAKRSDSYSKQIRSGRRDLEASFLPNALELVEYRFAHGDLTSQNTLRAL